MKKIKRNLEMKHWIKSFDDKIILTLIESSMDNFSGYKFSDFSDNSKIEDLVSTMKFYNIMRIVINKFAFANRFFHWYDKLNYDDKEEFNRLIKDKMIEVSSQ